MQLNPRLPHISPVAFAILIATGQPAQAGGFQVSEMTARGQGSRNAGAAATADSASTVFFNPAGLALLDQREVEVGVHLIVPDFEFHDTGSTNAIGGRAVGRTVSNGGTLAVVPNTFFAQPINDRITFGLGITAPYGLVTEYDADWVGRYNAIRSDMLTVDLNPAIGYRVNDQLSVGAGVSVQYLDVEMTNAIDFGTAGFLYDVPGIYPSQPAFDGNNEITGDSWSVGYNLGLIYEVTSRTRLGIGYRSKMDHDVDGRNRVEIPSTISSTLGISSFERHASAEITLPASAEIGISHQWNDRLTLLAGATWTDWTVFDELWIRLEGGADSIQPENWTDSWRYSLGASYRYDDKWTLRAGVQYDETPIPDAHRTPRVPGDSRYWTALGFTYRPSPEFAVDFAYTHVFLGNYGINDTDVTTAGITEVPVGNTVTGDYDADADVVSIQLQWNF